VLVPDQNGLLFDGIPINTRSELITLALGLVLLAGLAMPLFGLKTDNPNWFKKLSKISLALLLLVSFAKLFQSQDNSFDLCYRFPHSSTPVECTYTPDSRVKNLHWDGALGKHFILPFTNTSYFNRDFVSCMEDVNDSIRECTDCQNLRESVLLRCKQFLLLRKGNRYPFSLIARSSSRRVSLQKISYAGQVVISYVDEKGRRHRQALPFSPNTTQVTLDIDNAANLEIEYSNYLCHNHSRDNATCLWLLNFAQVVVVEDAALSLLVENKHSIGATVSHVLEFLAVGVFGIQWVLYILLQMRGYFLKSRQPRTDRRDAKETVMLLATLTVQLTVVFMWVLYVKRPPLATSIGIFIAVTACLLLFIRSIQVRTRQMYHWDLTVFWLAVGAFLGFSFLFVPPFDQMKLLAIGDDKILYTSWGYEFLDDPKWHYHYYSILGKPLLAYWQALLMKVFGGGTEYIKIFFSIIYAFFCPLIFTMFCRLAADNVSETPPPSRHRLLNTLIKLGAITFLTVSIFWFVGHMFIYGIKNGFAMSEAPAWLFGLCAIGLWVPGSFAPENKRRWILLGSCFFIILSLITRLNHGLLFLVLPTFLWFVSGKIKLSSQLFFFGSLAVGVALVVAHILIALHVNDVSLETFQKNITIYAQQNTSKSTALGFADTIAKHVKDFRAVLFHPCFTIQLPFFLCIALMFRRRFRVSKLATWVFCVSAAMCCYFLQISMVSTAYYPRTLVLGSYLMIMLNMMLLFSTLAHRK
jgi:hypothetical protein